MCLLREPPSHCERTKVYPMKLKDICTLDVACCTPTATIVEAARTMRQHHTGNLIVVDAADEDRVPAGIVTDRDIVVQVLAQGLDPARTAVRDVMVRDLVIADESEDSSTALERRVTRRASTVTRGMPALR